MDFCESRNLHQLIDFPTRCNAVLDLILSEHLGLVQKLLNLNTSDHVAILLTLESLSVPITAPPDRRVFHWCRAPWNRLRRYFSSYRWDFPESVELSVAYFTNVIISWQLVNLFHPVYQDYVVLLHGGTAIVR